MTETQTIQISEATIDTAEIAYATLLDSKVDMKKLVAFRKLLDELAIKN